MLKSLIFSFVVLFGSLTAAAAKDNEPQIYFFGASECDFCANELAFLQRFKDSDDRVKVRAFDIVASSDDATTFVQLVAAIGLSDPRVPMTVIGHHVFVGYEGDLSTGTEIKVAVEQCRTNGCEDLVKGFLAFGTNVAGAPIKGWVINQRFAKAAISR